MKNLIVFAAAAIVYPVIGIAGPPTYSVKELGANQYVVNINDAGQILTWSGVYAAPTYLYDATGAAVDLTEEQKLSVACKYKKSQGPLYVAATDLNSAGTVLINVFGPQSGDPGPDCIVLDTDGKVHHQETLATNAFAVAVNDSNQVIGNTVDAQNRSIGFGPGCDFIRSGSVVSAEALNNQSQIAGVSENGVELCTNGVWQVLPMFPGELGPIAVLSMNNHGDVIGNASVQTGPVNQASHSYVYSQGVTKDLGVIGKETGSSYYAQKINDLGQIVGAAYISSGPTCFLYQENSMFDLATLISSTDPLYGAIQFYGDTAINNHGVIVTDGINLLTGVEHVYVLSPL